MKTVYLHIGTHKTGTTSLQAFLHDIEGQLRDRGLSYLRAGRPTHTIFPKPGRPTHTMAHHLLPRSILGVGGLSDRACWDDAKAEIAGDPGDAFLASAEDFALLGDGQIEETRRHLEPHRVVVIVYLRHPIDYIISFFKYHVYMSVCGIHPMYRSFDEYLLVAAGRCNYAALIGRWARVYGESNIRVRLYDKVKEGDGLYRDFLGLVGIDPGSIAFPRAERENASPSPATVSALCALNRIERSRFRRLVPASLVGRLRDVVKRGDARGAWVGRMLCRLAEARPPSDASLGDFADRVARWNRPLAPDWVSHDDLRYLGLLSRESEASRATDRVVELSGAGSTAALGRRPDPTTAGPIGPDGTGNEPGNAP